MKKEFDYILAVYLICGLILLLLVLYELTHCELTQKGIVLFQWFGLIEK
jgi:hypothetical protein